MTKRNNERLNLRILFYLFLFLLGINLGNEFFGQQESQLKPPLSFQQIELLIKAQTPDNVIAGEISRRGLLFETTKDTISNLVRIGAGPKTIEAINNARSWINEAKQIIPATLKKIYRALDEGNPGIIRPFLSAELFSNSAKLDSICIPFRYRAHYIENIIERSNNEFEVMVRVLLKPLQEQAQILTFKRIQEFFILENVSDNKEWFGIWETTAVDIAKKVYYALKAGRWDIISGLRTSDTITFNPLFKYMELDASKIRDKIDSDSIKTEIVSYKGIKIRVGFDICEETWLNIPCTQCWLYIEPISNEFKLVGWKAENPWKFTPKPSEFDPNIEELTLNRFANSSDGFYLDSKIHMTEISKKMILK